MDISRSNFLMLARVSSLALFLIIPKTPKNDKKDAQIKAANDQLVHVAKWGSDAAMALALIAGRATNQGTGLAAKQNASL